MKSHRCRPPFALFLLTTLLSSLLLAYPFEGQEINSSTAATNVLMSSSDRPQAPASGAEFTTEATPNLLGQSNPQELGGHAPPCIEQDPTSVTGHLTQHINSNQSFDASSGECVDGGNGCST